MTQPYRQITKNICNRLDEPDLIYGIFLVIWMIPTILTYFTGDSISKSTGLENKLIFVSLLGVCFSIALILMIMGALIKNSKIKSQKFKNETKQWLFNRFSAHSFDVAIAHFDEFANGHKDPDFTVLYQKHLANIAAKDNSQKAIDDFYRLHTYVENFDEIQYCATKKLQQMMPVSPNTVVNA